MKLEVKENAMHNVCSHFYSLLYTSNSVSNEEFDKRNISKKKFYKFLDNPTIALNELERTTTEEADLEMIRNLKDTINSVWSKDIGIKNMETYLIDKLYQRFEDTVGKSKFEPYDYFNTFTRGFSGILFTNVGDGYIKSKEFVTPSTDEENNRKRDLILQVVCDRGFGDAVLNNNLTSFFNKLKSFITDLSVGYGNDKLSSLTDLLGNDSVMTVNCDPELFKDAFKYEDVLSNKVLTTELSSTEVILRNLEESGEPDSFNTLKALAECIATYTVKLESILKNIEAKYTNHLEKIKFAKAKSNDFYSTVLPTLKLRVADGLVNDTNEVNPEKINLDITLINDMVNRFDKWLVMYNYYAYLDLIETTLHLKHITKIKALMDSIVALSK